MPRLSLCGTRRLPASTFVELVVTIFLLSAFAATAFPLFWGASKASASHSVSNAERRADLSVAMILPRFCDEVRPPYWANPDKVFQSAGNDLKAFYYNGKKEDFLILRKENDTRLALVTSDASVSIDNLSDLNVDWWTKEKKIVGVTVTWRRNGQTMEFHASWGSFIL